jgi:NADH:ubiquinone oxidoreductase subunit 2 (subunit N)
MIVRGYTLIGVVIRILLKLGIFPFQEWFVSVSMTSNFIEFWLISIPQKIIPIWFLVNLEGNKSILVIRATLGAVLATLGGLRRGRVLNIIAYSSLMNTGWIALLIRNIDMFFFVYTFYGVSLWCLIKRLNMTGVLLNGQQTSQVSWISQISLVVLFLNLAGVPPFFNMWRKAFLMIELFCTNQIRLFMFFLLSSVIFLYIYLRLCFSLIRFRIKRLGWKTKLNVNSELVILFFLSFIMFLF